MSNFWLKLWSLLIAVLLACFVNYFFANDQGGHSVLQLIVPVEVKNLPPDRMVILPLNRQAEVTLQGPSLFLARIASTPLLFRVSAPAEANSFVAPLKREDLNLPPYVQVLNVRPPEIQFTLDHRVTKSVPLVVPRIGSMPENLKLEGLSINPDRIEVIGPETEVKGMGRLETSPLDLRDLNENVQRELEVRLPGGLTEVSVKKVNVSVEVLPIRVEEQFDNLNVEIRSTLSKGFSIEPSRVSVKVAGPREQVKSLKSADLVPFVRVSSTPAVGESLKVALDLPKGLALAAIVPDRVQVAKSAKAAHVSAKGNEKIK